MTYAIVNKSILQNTKTAPGAAFIYLFWGFILENQRRPLVRLIVAHDDLYAKRSEDKAGSNQVVQKAFVQSDCEDLLKLLLCI